MLDMAMKEVELYECKLEMLRRQKQSFMRKLLTGEVRLSVNEEALPC